MERSSTNACRKLGRHIKTLGVAGFAALALTGCAGNMNIADTWTADCKQISKRAEAKINWARVPDIELRVRNGEFSPMVMRLKQGRPYVLRIRNRDDKVLNFKAREFFLKNAVIAAGVEGVRTDETCFSKINIPPRQAAEIRMVAITDGTYEYQDSFVMLPLVFTGAPGGAIVVEERRETAGLN